MFNRIAQDKIKAFLKGIYEKLFKINDTPQKIALGFGLGVSLGIIPGTGPVAALFFAVVFKANRASALIASLATNTWLSLATFFLALRTGSAIFNVSPAGLKEKWLKLGGNLQWSDFKELFFRVVLPVLSGYLVISLALGLFAYLAVLIVIKKIKPIYLAGRRNEGKGFYKE